MGGGLRRGLVGGWGEGVGVRLRVRRSGLYLPTLPVWYCKPGSGPVNRPAVETNAWVWDRDAQSHSLVNRLESPPLPPQFRPNKRPWRSAQDGHHGLLLKDRTLML